MKRSEQAIDSLSNSISFRLDRNLKRTKLLNDQRARTKSLDPYAAHEDKFNDAEYNVLRDKYVQGNHIHADAIHKAESANENLEHETYEKAASLLLTSPQMADFETMHIGKVEIPRDSKKRLRYLENQKKYIDVTHARLRLFERFQTCKKEFTTLLNSINDGEDTAGAINAEIEDFRTIRSFDWQASKHAEVASIKAQILVEREDLVFAFEKLKKVSDEIEERYPDLSTNILDEVEELDTELPPTDDTIEVTNEDMKSSHAFGDTEGRAVFAWILGRVDKEGHILSMMYGQFTELMTVPSSGWVFMGMADGPTAIQREKQTDNGQETGEDTGYPYHGESQPLDSAYLATVDEDVEELENSVDSSSLNLTSARILEMPSEEQLRQDVLSITMMRGAGAVAKATACKMTTATRIYTVRGCSMHSINGRYLEWGSACHALMFRNHSGWMIFRHALREIPDLNILAENCYDAFKGHSLADKQEKLAAMAIRDLLLNGSQIQDGDPKFKRRFAEIGRAGMRLVSVDQGKMLRHEEAIRAKARSESNKAMLLQLQQMVKLRQMSEDQSKNDSASVFELPGSEGETSESGARPASSSLIGATDKSFVTGTALEFKVLMSRNREFQSSTLSYNTSTSEKFGAQEGELSRLVMANIEQREEILTKLKLEAAKIHTNYLQSEERSVDMDSQAVLGDFLQLVSALRECTITVSESIGAWTRLVTQQKARIENSKVKNSFDGSSHAGREYCVVIAYKGRTLYPMSLPMQSGSRRYCRGTEPPKACIDFKYVGVFKNKDVAFKEFENACLSLPLELRPVAYTDTPQMLTGLRSCRKHYLVRDTSVPPDLPCQECALKQFGNTNMLLPPVSNYPMPQYLWHGQNYLDRMWSDLDFLDDIILLKHLLPDLDTKLNPLLLTRDSLKSSLKKVIKKQDLPKQALKFLKGRIELLGEAQRAANSANKAASEPSLAGLPYANINKLKNNISYADISSALSKPRAHSSDASVASRSLMQRSWDAVPTLAEKSLSLSRDSALLNPNLGNNSLVKTGRVGSVTFGEITDDISVNSAVTSKSGSQSRLTLEKESFFTGSMGEISAEWPGSPMSDSRKGKTNSVTFSSTDALIERGMTGLDDERLQRALAILGQSTVLNRESIGESAVLSELASQSSSLQSSTVKSVGSKLKSQLSASAPVVRTGSRGAGGTTNSMTKTKTLGVTRRSKKEDGGDEAGLMPTITFYGHRGARMATVQMRQPIANRIPDVWCRSDIGEFKGLYKRPAMVVYEMRENKLMEAKKRAELRKQATAELRRAISKPFQDSDPEEIRRAIDAAMGISGSVLGLDIMRANKYLAELQVISGIVTSLQTHTRRFISRFRCLRKREERDRLWKARCLLEGLANALAKSVMSQVGKVCLKSVRKETSGAAYTKGFYLTGVRVVLSVHSATRKGAKSRVLCPACRTEKFASLRDCEKHVDYRGRAGCTCVWLQRPEHWMFQVYDPLDSNKARLTLSESEVRRYLDVAHNMSMITVAEHKQMLVGKSFGDWEPLLLRQRVHDMKEFNENQKKASEQYGALALIPTTLSNNTVRAARGQHPLPVDGLAKHAMKTVERPVQVRDPASDSADNMIRDWCWQPIHDVVRSKRTLASLKHDLGIAQRHSMEAISSWQQKAIELVQKQVVALEWSVMEMEDARSLYLRTTANYENSEATVKRIMLNMKTVLAKVEAEERNESENWKQAYDPVEDAVSGVPFVQRRTLQRLQVAHGSELEAKIIALSASSNEHEARLQLVNRLEKECIRLAAEVRSLESVVVKAEDQCREVDRMANETFETISSFISFPLQNNVPRMRKLRMTNPKLSYAKDPLYRARKEFRLAWNLIDRRVFRLRSLPGPVTWEGSHRCAVTAYQDPQSGFIIIQIGLDTDGVEEMRMHSDLQLPADRFSDLTLSEANEIFVHPAEVDKLLSRPPGWPANIIKRSTVVAKALTPHTSRGGSRRRSTAFELRSSLLSRAASPADQLKIAQEAEDLRAEAASSVVQESVSQVSAPETAAAIVQSTLPSLNSDSVRVYASRRASTAGLPKTYYGRRALQEKLEKERFSRLFTYLRVNPHSGRPCLGLVPTMRRTHVTSNALIRSLYLTDLVTRSPSAWTNEIFSGVRFISGKLAVVSMRECWGEVEARLVLASGPVVCIVIPFAHIIQSMSTKPLLLTSFLCETIVNVFSPDVCEHIMAHIDIQLPGENGWWRESIFGEVPKLRYITHSPDRCRGSIYHTHRIIGGKYFGCNFFRSTAGDIRLELGKSSDSSFWRNEYEGSTIVMNISRDELRAFVGRVSNIPKLLPKAVASNPQQLLHVDHLESLFRLILDVLVLNYDIVNNLRDQNGATEPDLVPLAHHLSLQLDKEPDFTVVDVGLQDSASEFSNSTVYVARDDSWFTNLMQRVKKALSLFNLWISRNKNPMAPPSQSTMIALFKSMQRLMKPPDWQLGLAKTSTETRLVEVFVGVASTNDVARFRHLNATAKHQRHQHRHHSKIASDISSLQVLSKYQKKGDPMLLVRPSFEEWYYHHHHHNHAVGFGSQSFWLTKICMDESKRILYVRVKQAHEAEDIVQRRIEASERQVMGLEDERSLTMNFNYEVAQCESFLAAVRKRTGGLISGGSRILDRERRRIASAKSHIEQARKLFDQAVDQVFVDLALVAYRELKARIHLTTGGRLTLAASDEGVSGKTRRWSLEDVERALPRLPTGEARYYGPAAVRVTRILASMHSQLDAITRVIFQSPKPKVSVHLLSLKSSPYACARPGVRRAPASDTITSASCRGCHSEVCPVHRPVTKLFRQYSSWTRNRKPLPWERNTSISSSEVVVPKDSRRVRQSCVHDNEQCLVISEPVIGPYDIVTVYVYDPVTSRRWALRVLSDSSSYNSSTTLPTFPLWQPDEDEILSNTIYVGKVLGQGTTSSGRASMTNDDSRTTAVPVTTLVAERFVCRTMMSAMLSMVVKAANKELDDDFSRAQTEVLQAGSQMRHCRLSEESLASRHCSYSDLFRIRSKFGKDLPKPKDEPESPEGRVVTVFGVFIPADQHVLPTPIVVPSSVWNDKCAELLQCSVEAISKALAIPVLVFQDSSLDSSSSKLQPNVRLNEWTLQYTQHVGWRKGMEFVKHRGFIKKSLRADRSLADKTYCGDAVVMLRFGKRDFQQLVDWGVARYQVYLDEVALETRLAEEKRLRMESNFEKFRLAVLDLAERYLFGFEMLVGCIPQCRHDYSTDERIYATTQQARQLMSGNISDKKKGGRLATLGDSYLIDRDVALTYPEAMALFDQGSVPDSLPWVHEEVDDESDADLCSIGSADPSLSSVTSTMVRPRPQDVVYAIYQLHCSRCARAYSHCIFPGCGTVRALADVLKQQVNLERQGSVDTVCTDLSELRGTGRHPIEMSLKRYLSAGSGGSSSTSALLMRSHSLRLMDAPMKPKEVPGTEVAVTSRSQSMSSISVEQPYQWPGLEATLRYQNVMLEAGKCRYLNRRVIGPELRYIMDADAVLEASGGEWEKEELQLPYEAIDDVSPSVPPSFQEALEQDSASSSSSDDDDDALNLDLPEVVIEIPLSAVNALVRSGRDLRGGVPRWAASPYLSRAVSSARTDPEDSQPMSSLLFAWITKRLSLAHEGYSFESMRADGTSTPNKTLTQQMAVRAAFDRLHCEGVVAMKDGSLIVVQVLQGVLVGAACGPDERRERSRAPASVRFLSGPDLARLQSGLTVVVHDRKGDISRAVLLADIDLLGLSHLLIERNLERSGGALDAAKLAAHIVQHAPDLIRLTRIGAVLVGVVVETQQRNPVAQHQPSEDNLLARGVRKAQVAGTAAGHRLIVVDKTSEAIELAKKTLEGLKSKSSSKGSAEPAVAELRQRLRNRPSSKLAYL